MAKPEVVLKFTGDSGDLQKSLDGIGSSARDMAGEVGKASDGIKDSSRNISGNVVESADRVEQRATGFRDTITGLQDGFKGLTAEGASFQERMLLIGFGVGDLASGVSNLLGPALTGLATTLKVQVGGAMTFIAAHPVALALIALAALFVLLWTNSETFQRIVKDVFRSVGDAFVALGRVAADVWNNVIAPVLNFFIEGVKKIIDLVKGIGSAFSGITKSVGGFLGKIPGFQTGGVVPGPPGQAVPILAHGGERVIPARSREMGAGGPIVVNLSLDGQQLASVLVDPVRRRLLDTSRRNVTVGLT